LVGEDLCLVVKTALDALRAHLLQEGQSGIPVDNRRLMDELQQCGVLIPTGDRAVWLARVVLPDWQQDLTLLRLPAARLWPDRETRPDACHGTISPLAVPPHGADAPRTSPASSPGVIDEPLLRDTGEASDAHSAEADTSTEPAPLAPPIARVTAAPALAKPVDLGQAFLDWLKAGLANGQFPINTVNARVHRVREGVLLVSPGIFRDYGNAAQAPWDNIQKRFQKLRLHRKTPEGFNIWTYSVVGERRTRELKGILIDDAEKALGPDLTLPPPNVHVVLVGRKNK
ncbi:MAG: conjugal transfer nickase/helicase domain-containing protein, partial [Gammaproteobacteria bacterium]